MKSLEQSTNSYIKAIAYFLGFIIIALLVYIFMVLKEILLPFTIAIFLTYLFYPLIEYSRKYKIPKWLSLIIILILTFLVYYLVVLLVVSSLSDLPDKWKIYSNNISNSVKSILAPFNLTARELSSYFNFNIQKFDSSSLFQSLFKTGIIQNIFSSISSMLKDFFVTMIFWIFMILGKSNFENRIMTAFESRGEKIETTIKSFNIQLQSYIVVKTIISLVVTIVAIILFLIYGIDFAFLWGLLTFILNFIPNIGPLIAVVGPILISLFQHGLGFPTISFAVLLIVLHNAMGNLVEPKFLGRQMDLSPVFVLLSLIFWGWIWGIPGMFLSVPIAAAIRILFLNIPALRPIAILMGTKTNQRRDKSSNEEEFLST
jgi:predicted PurR-regulated permease PerM